MYGIYANIWGILMVNGTPYMAYMDPMGMFWLLKKYLQCLYMFDGQIPII